MHWPEGRLEIRPGDVSDDWPTIVDDADSESPLSESDERRNASGLRRSVANVLRASRMRLSTYSIMMRKLPSLPSTFAYTFISSVVLCQKHMPSSTTSKGRAHA